jgi:hypothetical protein
MLTLFFTNFAPKLKVPAGMVNWQGFLWPQRAAAEPVQPLNTRA